MEVSHHGLLKLILHLMVLPLNKFQELQAMEDLFHTQSCHQPAHHMSHLQPHGAIME
jgi:hypothetical protein